MTVSTPSVNKPELPTRIKCKNGYRTKTLYCLFLVTALAGCDVTEQLPSGSQLTISPEQRTLNIPDRSNDEGVCFIDPDLYVDWPIVLALTTGEGTPVGHQNVQVYLDFGSNTFPGYPVMALYDDRRGNSNGVVDDFELVSDTDDDIATVKTDLYGGDRPLLLRINISCPFKGDVFAFVDGVTGTSSIDVVADTEESL